MSRRTANWMTAAALVIAGSVSPAGAQSNPTARTLPYSQNFGDAAFSSMPAGTAAWGGLSGSAIDSESDAAASSPTQDASVSTATAAASTAGAFGLANGGNARFYIQTSGSTSLGVSQLVLAVNTIGQSSVSLSYDMENIKAETRTVGALCQFRPGTSGPWTTLTASTGPNPYIQSGGNPGNTTPVEIILPPAALNHENIQIRWAIWRGHRSGQQLRPRDRQHQRHRFVDRDRTNHFPGSRKPAGNKRREFRRRHRFNHRASDRGLVDHVVL